MTRLVRALVAACFRSGCVVSVDGRVLAFRLASSFDASAIIEGSFLRGRWSETTGQCNNQTSLKFIWLEVVREKVLTDAHRSQEVKHSEAEATPLNF